MRTAKILKLDQTYIDAPAYTVKDFPYDQLSKLAQKSKKRKGESILSNFATFDIESTTLTESAKNAFMYHWQMCVQGICVYGRYWHEWTDFINRLVKELNISSERKYIIYVHNLSYEAQFMRKFIERDIAPFEGFYLDKRKPLSLRLENGIEFRCSWKLTNMSLEKACKFEKGCEIGKQAGDLDYKKIRTPQTPLTDREFGYCIADVLSLYDMIKNRLANEKDTLESIPLTSTGYVRRDCRRAAGKEQGYRDRFIKMSMSKEIYTLLKEAGRGGDTHANRFLSGKIMKDVDSFDVQSSYPAMLMCRKFPMTKFVAYGDIESKAELQNLLNTKACLFRVAFTNIRLKRHIAMPYLSIDKALAIKGLSADNGRVLKAELASYAVTDIDYKLIESQYTWDEMAVGEMHIADYGYLPESIRSVVKHYFELKTTLKGELSKAKKSADSEKIADLEYEYGKSKNRLNGIFGMMYTDPIRDQIRLEGDTWICDPQDIDEALAKFYKSRNSFLVYAWGIWTTAHARKHLADLVELTGQHTTIYCDTDSSKCLHFDEVVDAVEARNKEIEADAYAHDAYCDYEGIRYFMGVYEYESRYDKFKTLGAKKYVYEEEGEVHVTISGVNKAAAPHELRTIYNFIPGFTFYKAGGMEMTYIDQEISEITVNGCTFESAACIAATDSTYELGITDEYERLIDYNPLEDIDKSDFII